MLRDRLDAFAAHDATQKERLDRLEQALEAQRADRGLLTGMAHGLQASFDGILDVLQDLGKRMDGLAAPPPQDDAGFSRLAEGLMATAERAQTDRAALIQHFERFDETHLAAAMRQAMGDPLRAIAGDLASIDARLTALETGRGVLPDAARALLPAPTPMEAERSMIHRMIAGFGMLMERLNAGLGTLDSSLERLGGALDLPDLDHWKTISAQLEVQTDRLVAMEQVVSGLLRKDERKEPSAGFAVERGQLQQLLVGFRMISQELSESAARASRVDNPAAAPIDLSPALAEMSRSIGAMQAAIAEMISSAEMRLAAQPASAPSPNRLLPGAPAIEAGETLIERAVAGNDAAMRRMEALRLALADDLAQLRASAGPSDSDGSRSAAMQRVVASLEAASNDLDGRICDFLSVSAAFSHELTERNPQTSRKSSARGARMGRKSTGGFTQG